MVEYRNVKKEDAGELWEFLKKLDTETDFMMYEPGEREQCTSAAELSRDIEENVQNGGDFFRIAVWSVFSGQSAGGFAGFPIRHTL